LRKKIFGIIISLFLILTITLVPATSFPSNNQSNNSIELQDLSNKKIIQQLLDEIINKINNNENPEDILKTIITFQEIRENIKNLSDRETLNKIDILFSNKSIFQKILQLHQYSKKLENKRIENNTYEFENELIDIISNNYSSFHDISIFSQLFSRSYYFYLSLFNYYFCLGFY